MICITIDEQIGLFLPKLINWSMEHVMLKFPSMEELYEFKSVARLSGIYSAHEYSSNTIKGHLTEAEIELAMNAYSAIKVDVFK